MRPEPWAWSWPARSVYPVTDNVEPAMTGPAMLAALPHLAGPDMEMALPHLVNDCTDTALPSEVEPITDRACTDPQASIP